MERHIVNQIVAGLIQYGKICHYFYDPKDGWKEEKINSDGLAGIQVEEAFKKQMFLSLAWSIARLNYFCNYGGHNPEMMDQGTGKDILFDEKEKNQFFASLSKDEDDTAIKEFREKIATCFPVRNTGESPDETKEIVNLLKDIFRSIEHLRNHIFHYQQNNLFEILTCNTIKSKLETSKIFLQRDIDSLQENFKEQMRSSGLMEYYSFELLENIFTSPGLSFNLYASHYAMMPSFKNVFTKGCNLYKSTEGHKGVRWLVDEESFKNKEGWLAYKNLLQLIYYHSFLPAINEDESLITNFINKTKEWNKKESIEAQKNQGNKPNNYKHRYANMPDYRSPKSLKGYFESLQHLQSMRENEENTSDKQNNYYLDFVRDVYVQAFDDFLNEKLSCFYDLLIKDQPNGIDPEESLLRLFNGEHPVLEMQTALEPSTAPIDMYPFLRMLDQRELNKMLHQFIRYRTSLQDRGESTSEFCGESQKVEELIALVQFTFPQPVSDGHYQTILDKYFSKFIEHRDPKAYVPLYYQQDTETPILHRSMSLVGRSGAMALYCAMFCKESKPLYRVSKNDYQKYLDFKNPEMGSQSSPIEQKQEDLRLLHQELVRIGKDNKENNQKAIIRYNTLLNEVHNEYRTLQHKLTFEALYKIHQIHIDILGRFAAFAEDWERDMFFMLTALKSMKMIDLDVNAIFFYDEQNKDGVVKKLKKQLKNGHEGKKLFCELCWSGEDYNAASEDEILDRLFTRNSVAHLNHITQFKPINGSPQKSIIQLVNRMRVLLAYDLKRQNSVTKAVQEIMEKQHKIKIVLKPKKCEANVDHRYKPVEFELIDVKSCMITHLQNLQKPIKIKAHTTWMLDLVRELLEFQSDK